MNVKSEYFVRRFRFRLRTILLILTVAAFILGFYPREAEPLIGYYFGSIGEMDKSLQLESGEIIVHTTDIPTQDEMQSEDYEQKKIGTHVVVVVSDLSRITRNDAKEIAYHPDFGGERREVQFIELQDQHTAKIRSFEGYWCWEKHESVAGALAAVKVINQLNFRISKEIREPVGFAGEPSGIIFSTNRKLDISYTPDWGSFYLREVAGPEQLTRNLLVHPYTERERTHAKKLLQDFKEKNHKQEKDRKED